MTILTDILLYLAGVIVAYLTMVCIALNGRL